MAYARKDSKQLLCGFFIWPDQSRLGGQDGNTIAKGQEKVKQTKEVDPCCSEEGMDGSMLQDRVIQGIQNPIKFYVRAAGKKSSPQFPRPMTRNCSAWSASAE